MGVLALGCANSVDDEPPPLVQLDGQHSGVQLDGQHTGADGGDPSFGNVGSGGPAGDAPTTPRPSASSLPGADCLTSSEQAEQVPIDM